MEIFQNLKQGYKLGNIVQRLLYWNVGIAIVFILFKSFYKPGYLFLVANTSLNANLEIFITKPWTLISYSFLHADFIHLLFNLLMLYFIGQLFQTFFNKFQLLAVYFFGGIFAGIIFLIGSLFFENKMEVVGASGAIMALLFAITTYRPNMNVRLLLIGNVKIWYIAAFFVFLDVIQIPLSNAGGHITHLGGALFGFIYIQCLNKGFDFGKFFVWLHDLFSKDKNKYTKFKNVYTNSKTNQASSSKTKFQINDNQKEIDIILDKISKSGYESLSKDEKEFLFKQR